MTKEPSRESADSQSGGRPEAGAPAHKKLLNTFVAGGVLAVLVGFFLQQHCANAPPEVSLQIEPASRRGFAPFPIVANGSRSRDPEGQPLSFLWKIDGERIEESGALLERTFRSGGRYRIGLQVSDGRKNSPDAQQMVHVLPPVKTLQIQELTEDTEISEPAYTLVLPKRLVTHGFKLTIEAPAILADGTEIVSYSEENADDGPAGPNGSRGPSGRGGDRDGGDGRTGLDGQPGHPGSTGYSASPVQIETAYLEGSLAIRNIGQAGGKGGDGGDGGRGGDGANGRNRGGNAICSNARSPGNGGDAGAGGAAGNGGAGGSGGSGGSVEIVVDDLNASLTIVTTAGAPGAAGRAGEPGGPGSPGRGGKKSHCGGGGESGNGASAGAEGTDGTPGSSGKAGLITVQLGDVHEVFESGKATFQPPPD